MKSGLHFLKRLLCVSILSFFVGQLSAQVMEWRLVKAGEDNTDPDGAGPAIGSVSFTLQIHAVSGSVANINTISTGYSYQVTNNMVPSNPGCPVSPPNNPANIVVSPSFPGWNFNSVNQCGIAAQTSDGKIFDARAVGTFEGNPITVTTTWVDMFTVTLWALSTPTAVGYVIINSGEGGTPGEFTTYAVADQDGNSIPVNSLTYTTPLFVGPPLPITLSNFGITCTGNGASLNWQTLSEQNSKNFEIEKSTDGVNGWTSVGSLNAAGNSNAAKQYQFLDIKGGNAYYRLKQYDNDGRFTYSAVQSAKCLSKQIELVVYPIPAKNILNIVLNSDTKVKTSLVLIDISGRVIKQQSTTLEKGVNNIQLNVAGVAAGEYILKIPGSEFTRSQMVMISK